MRSLIIFLALSFAVATAISEEQHWEFQESVENNMFLATNGNCNVTIDKNGDKVIFTGYTKLEGWKSGVYAGVVYKRGVTVPPEIDFTADNLKDKTKADLLIAERPRLFWETCKEQLKVPFPAEFQKELFIWSHQETQPAQKKGWWGALFSATNYAGFIVLLVVLRIKIGKQIR